MNNNPIPKIADTRWILVGHAVPDTDCSSAITLFMKANGLTIDDIDRGIVRLVFVKPGERWSEPIPPNTIVAHFDTGRISDPDTLNFDHHVSDSPYKSATEMVFTRFWNTEDEKAAPKYLRDFVAYVNWVDAPSHRQELSDKAQHRLQEIQQQLQDDEIDDLVQVGIKMPGPRDMARIVNNLRPMPDQRRFLIIWEYITGWFNAYDTNRAINAFIRKEKRSQEKNGLVFFRLGVNAFDTKQLRSVFNRNWRNQVDVVVSGYCPASGDINEMCYSITLIGDAQDYISGMDRLRDALYAQFPSLSPEHKDVFLHKDKFVIYLPAKPDITLEAVDRVVKQHLRRLIIAPAATPEPLVAMTA